MTGDPALAARLRDLLGDGHSGDGHSGDGHSSDGGKQQAPWTTDGFAPAGPGVFSTAGDLARLVAALLTREDVPGASATRPLAPTDHPGRRVGLFWISSSPGGEPTVWHNGLSGGTRAFVGLQPGTGRGVVLLATTDAASVDTTALALLAAQH